MPAACRRRFTSRIKEVLPKRRGASIRMFWPPRSSRSRTSRSASRSVNASPDTIRPKRKGLDGGAFMRAGITQPSITQLRELAYSVRVWTAASGGALQRSSARIVARQQRAPVDAGIPGAEVGQGEAVAGSLRRRLAAANLAQVPVKELVAIDEAEHLAPGAKANASAEPLKGEPASGFASGAIVDLLLPAAERLGDLELDQPVLVPAEGGQVGRLPVAERPGGDGVAGRRREVGQPAAQGLGLDTGNPRPQRDRRPGPAERGEGHAFSLGNSAAHSNPERRYTICKVSPRPRHSLWPTLGPNRSLCLTDWKPVDAQPLSELDLARLRTRVQHSVLERVAAELRRPSDRWPQTVRWTAVAVLDELRRWQAALPGLLRGDFVFTLALWVAVFSVAAAVVAQPTIPLPVRYSAGLAAVAYLYLYAELARIERPLRGRRLLLGLADGAIVAALGP